MVNVSNLQVNRMADGYALDVGSNPDPVALIALEDPDMERRGFADNLTCQFGLTPAEASVALVLMDGDGHQAVAARLDVSGSTVRTHMPRIFEKTDIHQQAQLFRLLMEMSSTTRSKGA